MQALLVLYLANYLLLPETIGSVAGMEALAASSSAPPGRFAAAARLGGLGPYFGCVYLTPMFGGLIADRVLGRAEDGRDRRHLTALGHSPMAFEVSFLVALACLILGVGCSRTTSPSQVGDLYNPGDKRRATPSRSSSSRCRSR